MRSLHDLDALARLRREARGVARDHANRLAAVENVLEDLVADSARGRGDDDHMISNLKAQTAFPVSWSAR